MNREIPQHLHTDEVFLGFSKVEVLTVLMSYGIFTVLYDMPITGIVIGIVLAHILVKWKEEKPRGIIYHKLRRIIPIESGLFYTGIHPIDRRVVG